MNVWCHLPTIFRYRLFWRRVWPIIGLLALCVALTTTLFFSNTSHAAPGINQTINFQGRLLTSSGGVVADGYYNIQFKIYQDGSGTTAGDTDGTLKWTETYLNNGGSNGIEVKNGFFTVNLGSLTPFGSSIDWNQDTLWLSMNVAGSSTSCTTFNSGTCSADGEMLPMKKMAATPYAMNANAVGGITASGLIQNTTTPQTADFSITGTGTASTLQGNTSVISPLFDGAPSSTMNIGTSNASTINLGTSTSNQTINIGTDSGVSTKTITLGATYGNSYTKLQGGNLGVGIYTGGGFVVHNNSSSLNVLNLEQGGSATFNIDTNDSFNVKDHAGNALFSVNDSGSQIATGAGAHFVVNGDASFVNGITIQGSGSTHYTTPGGYNMSTAINIPNYAVSAYSTVMAFGLPSTSAATARGLIVADARTGDHQSTIGVLSPDENNIMGFSWNGSTTTGYLSNTANTLALQGNGLNLLTATNNAGAANVGIGNAATAGYALDVTGDINASGAYRIGGSTALTNSALSFGGTAASTITSASGQALNINGNTGISLAVGGVTKASIGSTNIQIGTGSGTGTPTLLTFDHASSAPTVNSSLLGSMYYDTTLGKLQCYEAAGWGSCGAAPDDFVSLSPQYANAVVHGSGTGTLTTDLCSDVLNINDGTSSQPTVCGTHETYNYYNWTSSQTTSQSRSIYVTYQLPSSFKNFDAGATSLMGRTDSSDAAITYQVYRNNSTNGLSACGSAVSVSTGAQTSWQKGSPSGTADPSSCSFAAGDSIVFKITVSSANNANAYVSNLNFAFKNQ